MHSSPPPTSPEQGATIQLLVRMPNGTVEQVDVPPNAPVSSIGAALSEKLSPDARYSFANTDLDPDATLLDTNIAETYAHANSLINLVDSSNPNPEAKAAALDSVIAVVERVSNGIKSMSALCAAAASEDVPPDASEETAQPVSPEQLARSLTMRLPKLFGQEHDPLADAPPPQQPSISSIREARRVMRDITLPKDERTFPLGDDHHIGQSTHAPIPPPLPFQQKNSGHDSVVLANAEKSTWLEDVRTTWEVDAVRQSGVLYTSKLGLELGDYLKTLEASAVENDQEQPEDDDTLENAQNNLPDDECPGDSSDDEHTIDTHQNGSAPLSQSSTEPNAPQITPDVNTSSPGQAGTPWDTNGPSSVQQPTNLRPAATSIVPAASDPSFKPLAVPISTTAPSITTQGSTTSNAPMSYATVSAHVKSPSPSVVSTMGFPSPSVHSQARMSVVPIALKKDHPSQLSLQPRQAAKIAPAPLPSTFGLPPNGVLNYPSIPIADSQWAKPVTPHVPAKKKRGRKRKNPELTDEERILWRKQKNRESAKLSRVRRKVIAAEYEEKLNELLDENTMLRKQVDGLNNRLAYMQNLLTVSVTNAPQPPS